MSLSGSQETQSAIAHVNVSAGGQVEVQKEATEDRRILGIDFDFRMDTGASQDITARAHLGATQTHSPADSFVDGAKWSYFTSAENTNDTTNSLGTGYYQDGAMVDTSDQNVEWDEDETLTVLVNESQGNSSVDTFATIYYEEL